MMNYEYVAGVVVLIGLGGVAYLCLNRKKSLKTVVQGHHSISMSRAVEYYIKTTAGLGSYAQTLKETDGNDEKVQDMSQHLSKEFHLNNQERKNLTQSLQHIHNARRAYLFLEKLRKLPYDRKNAAHEKLLMYFWEHAKPGVKLTNRDSKEWGELGFQGEDPATDFRGGGLLSLLTMAHMAARNKGSLDRIVNEANDTARPDSWYMYAVASINFTFDVIGWLKSGRLDEYFYHYVPNDQEEIAILENVDIEKAFNNSSIDTFCTKHCALMNYFHEQWLTTSPHVMDFNIVKDKWLKPENVPTTVGLHPPLVA